MAVDGFLPDIIRPIDFDEQLLQHNTGRHLRRGVSCLVTRT